ncbi:hypothetical protein CRG98_031468 [Punica granatum]|uniref:Uncharacterized protein n=1 Tax=Punica granatum TaxID=22663 RepID=A0A2I0IXG8_PUNGR|nr:hypothetical protein CRG98_031468 [Punica granatum]
MKRARQVTKDDSGGAPIRPAPVDVLNMVLEAVDRGSQTGKFFLNHATKHNASSWEVPPRGKLSVGGLGVGRQPTRGPQSGAGIESGPPKAQLWCNASLLSRPP